MLVRWKPFTEMLSLFEDSWKHSIDTSWKPLVDIREDENNFYIDMELPGIKRENVKLTVKDNQLTVEGERKSEEEIDYYKSERYYGSFVRSFILPASADSEKVEASFVDGLLTINIAKKIEEASKQIEIKIRGSTKRSL